MKRAVLVAIPLAGLLGAMPALAATGGNGESQSAAPHLEAVVDGGVTLATPDTPTAPSVPDPRPAASSAIAGLRSRGAETKDAAAATVASAMTRASEAEPKSQAPEQASADQPQGTRADGSAGAGGASVSASVMVER